MSQVLYDVPGPRARRRSRILSVVTGVVLVAVLAFAAVKLQQAGQFSAERWLVLNDPLVWGLLLQGLWVVLQSAAVAAVLAILLGMVLALLRMSEHRVVRYAVTVVLEFFRGMPVLLMMLFIYLIFPIGPYWSVVTALTLYNGAIIGEALRAGIVSLPKGQREAGLSIGLGGLQTRLLIEFPQAFRNMIPIIVAQLVVLLKDTSLGYIIGMQEFLRRGRLTYEFFGRDQYAFSTFVIMIALYLAINLTVSWIARRLAKGSSRKPRKAAPPTDGGTNSIDPTFGSARIGGSAGTGATNT